MHSLSKRFLAALVAASFSGCGAQVNSIDRSTVRLADTSEKMAEDLKAMTTEIQQDRELIQAIAKSLVTMSDSMQELASIAALLKTFITDRETKKEPPASTPNIEDILK